VRRAGWWATGLALVFAFFLSDNLLRTPVQRSDSLELILDAQRSPSAAATFATTVAAPGYMRPLFRVENKLLFDVGGVSSLQWAYRGFHACLLTIGLLLFARAARVTTERDFAAFAMAMAVLVGLHTFRGAVGEAYPVNHYLNVAVVCLLTLVLAQSGGGVWIDVAATVGLVYSIFILETGVLVWVIAGASWLVGWRGISSRALAAVTALLLAYVYLRFAYLPVGVPSLSERSSGFLFSVLDPPELVRRFGDQPAPFYAYNVVTSMLSVLFSEPRAGRFVAVDAWRQDALLPRMLLALFTSLVTTCVIGHAAVRCWTARRLDDNARYVAVFAAVLAGNSLLSFAYTKDEIMLPAGIFYALAAYAGARVLFESMAVARLRPAPVAIAIALAIISTGWTVRAAGVPYFQRSQAFKHRGDWGQLAGELRRGGREDHLPSDERHLIDRLRDDALAAAAPNPRFEPRWARLVWED
jgi:hypothetical protein